MALKDVCEGNRTVCFDEDKELDGYPLEIVVKVAPIRQAALEPRAPQADTIDVGEIADFSTAAGSAETLEVASIFTEPFVDEDPAVALPETKAQDWHAETIKTEFEPGRELGDEPQAGLYFVIGSFREHKNARKLRSQYRILTPSVLAANLEQGIVFRVVVGPFEQANAKRVHRSIYRAGITDSWAIRVRPGQWSMALIDAPAEAPIMAELKAEPKPLTAMDYVQLLAQLIY
ncbi:SPOR domain-containing protein [PVC group bacterium]|nr:SPOR domain-containing protein [PVC group bacterium]